MHEVATTLTDFLMAILSLVYAMGQVRRRPLFRGPVLFFLAFALAALFGGLWHGFFSVVGTPGERVVWWLSMWFGGISAAGLALIGLELLGFRLQKPLLRVIALFMLAFGAYVWIDPHFLATIVMSACGTLICITGLSYRLRQQIALGLVLAMTGLTISVIGAIAQQKGVALHPESFDHNATYHLFLILSLGFFHAGLRRIYL